MGIRVAGGLIVAIAPRSTALDVHGQACSADRLSATIALLILAFACCLSRPGFGRIRVDPLAPLPGGMVMLTFEVSELFMLFKLMRRSALRLVAGRRGQAIRHSPKGAAPHRYSRTALFAALTALSGCSGGILEPRGPIGAANRLILFNALEIMLAIVIPTIVAALVFAWWFRESNTRAIYRPRFVYSGRIELIVWAIPILVICFLGGVIWIGSYDLDPAKPITSEVKPLEVQVVSLDWKWLFIYPDQRVASVNQLVVPVGVPVHFDLTSASVMNVFFVPQLGSMIYTMNHMVTQLYLQADHAGDFDGMSAQFSGDGFSDMAFTARAVAQDEFAGWIAQARQAGPVLDRSGYADLARQSTTRAFTYREADPSLFRAVVTQQIPPQAGPNPDSPTSEH